MYACMYEGMNVLRLGTDLAPALCSPLVRQPNLPTVPLPTRLRSLSLPPARLAFPHALSSPPPFLPRRREALKSCQLSAVASVIEGQDPGMTECQGIISIIFMRNDHLGMGSESILMRSDPPPFTTATCTGGKGRDVKRMEWWYG